MADSITQKLKVDPDRRGGILTHMAKFAIDSIINCSLKVKSLSGKKQVYEILQEQLKDPTLSACLDANKKPEDIKLAMEKRAKVEKIQDDRSIVKQKHKISAIHVQRSDHPEKIPDESISESDIPQNNRRKIFIRSRL